MNLFTGESETSLEERVLPYDRESDSAPPAQVLLTGTGREVLIVHGDGRAERIDARDPANATVAEVVDLTPEEGERLTSTTFLVGRSTLITGSDRGVIRAWFDAPREDGATPDGKALVEAHTMRGPNTPVVHLAASPRSRLIVATFGDGTVQAYHVTSESRLLELDATDIGSPFGARILPKEDHVLAFGSAGLKSWEVDFRSPEASFSSFFRPVWYETYPGPQHVWQSEGASDAFETKLGFVPLVYGTIKATFYSMLFGTPLALLAALFTSEFLDRRLRAPIKSSIEMMASLPSVVLGFLAGLVIAPFAQTALPAILAAIVTVPLALLLGAHLWQFLPTERRSAWSGWQRVVAMAAALPVGVLAAAWVGPGLERLFFAGSIELWLGGKGAHSIGAWGLLLLPVSVLLVTLVGGRGYAAFLARRGESWTRGRTARVDLLKLGVGLVATLGVAFGVGGLLEVSGFDPRGSLLDTYDPHNALLVGFVMGFAIIPIIYTLAEDALSSVPEHLRLASLGAGATPWQTAVRVVLPTATSGLFSAVMIGLGRAVGETMIVLMATGNTPIMEINPFSGFRTLSANIAVELPEAVQGSTHYRALFLAALVLFAMTFVLNTCAETVRIRFRKRSSRL
ncbi:MAG TPA: ABC transporter permease subunit [Planctomycetes bacterium]|nr:ABC transporter permease subunit [Planctomycetota bacterium]